MLKTWWQDVKRISYIDWHWLIVWVTIYISFLLLDIFAPSFWGSSILKYSGIFLCIIYAWRKYHSDTKLILAILFTFLADTILVWTSWEVAGVFVFCIAQGLHFMRLTKLNRKFLIIIAVCVSIVLVYGVLRHENVLYDMAIIYAVLLICNLAMSFRIYKANKNSFNARCIWYGFLAFIACDVCVGIRHLMIDGIIPDQFLPMIAYFVWVFYYPSQVLLTNSSLPKEGTRLVKVAKKSSIS